MFEMRNSAKCYAYTSNKSVHNSSANKHPLLYTSRELFPARRRLQVNHYYPQPPDAESPNSGARALANMCSCRVCVYEMSGPLD